MSRWWEPRGPGAPRREPLLRQHRRQREPSSTSSDGRSAACARAWPGRSSACRSWPSADHEATACRSWEHKCRPAQPSAYKSWDGTSSADDSSWDGKSWACTSPVHNQRPQPHKQQEHHLLLLPDSRRPTGQNRTPQERLRCKKHTCDSFEKPPLFRYRSVKGLALVPSLTLFPNSDGFQPGRHMNVTVPPPLGRPPHCPVEALGTSPRTASAQL